MANYKKVEGTDMNVDQIWQLNVKPKLNTTYGASNREATSEDYPEVISNLEGDLVSAYKFVKIQLKQDATNINLMKKFLDIADRVLSGVDDVINSFSKETWLQASKADLETIKQDVAKEKELMQQKIDHQLGNTASRRSSTSLKP